MMTYCGNLTRHALLARPKVHSRENGCTSRCRSCNRDPSEMLMIRCPHHPQLRFEMQLLIVKLAIGARCGADDDADGRREERGGTTPPVENSSRGPALLAQKRNPVRFDNHKPDLLPHPSGFHVRKILYCCLDFTDACGATGIVSQPCGGGGTLRCSFDFFISCSRVNSSAHLSTLASTSIERTQGEQRPASKLHVTAFPHLI